MSSPKDNTTNRCVAKKSVLPSDELRNSFVFGLARSASSDKRRASLAPSFAVCALLIGVIFAFLALAVFVLN